ncbi:MAG: tetratricopeptide repeat protein [Bacteroidota bacterium]
MRSTIGEWLLIGWLLSIGLLFAPNGYAQHLSFENQRWPVLTLEPAFQDTITQAIDRLYNRQEDAAAVLLKSWQERYPQHPIWPFWSGLEHWWDILEDLDNTQHDSAFFAQMDATVDSSERVLTQFPEHRDALMVKAVALGLEARLHSNRRSWWKAMKKGRAAMKALEQLRDSDPENPELLFADGLYHYYVAYVPEAYPALKTVMWMMDGDKQLGLDQLREASETSLFVREEATYFLANILLNYESKPNEALHHAYNLTRHFPDNPYYDRLLVRTLIAAHKYDLAGQELDRRLARWQDTTRAIPSGVSREDIWALEEELLTWKGRLLYRNHHYQAALDPLKQALERGANLKGGSGRTFYLQAAYLRGRCYYNLEEWKLSAHWFAQVANSEAASEYKEPARRMLRKAEAK